MHEMPKPSEHHRKLHRFAGNWAGEEKLSPSPWGPGGPAMGRLTGKIDLDGFFVVSDYVEEKDGKTVFKGHNVFGWDPQANDVVWYWFDSMGFPPAVPSHGNWDGDTLVLRNSSPQGDGRYTFRFEGKDRYYFSIENSRDGGKSWQKFMEGNYKRV